MSLRYQRRINLGRGLGINLSKSGVSMSKRTPFGSIGTSGYSIKSGIPGLFFRKYSGNKKGAGKDFALMVLIIMLFAAFFYFAFAFIKNLFLLTVHYTIIFFRNIRQALSNRKAKKDLAEFSQAKNRLFVQFETASLPENMRKMKIFVEEVYVKNGQYVNEGVDIASVTIGTEKASIPAQKTGVVTFYKFPGSQIRKNNIIYRIDD